MFYMLIVIIEGTSSTIRSFVIVAMFVQTNYLNETSVMYNVMTLMDLLMKWKSYMCAKRKQQLLLMLVKIT